MGVRIECQSCGNGIQHWQEGAHDRRDLHTRHFRETHLIGYIGALYSYDVTDLKLGGDPQAWILARQLRLDVHSKV